MWLRLLILLVSALLAGCSPQVETRADGGQPSEEAMQVGAERPQLYLSRLKDKRVGLVVNQTSRAGDQHLVDHLLAEGVEVRRIFAPEHGFRGDHDAGAKVASTVDEKTGLPLYSIYGKTRKPEPEALADLDLILFDIQDVGVRFYTYISSMHYMMEAAAENGLEFMVLDRPNPNGDYVDGPLLEPKFRSFVGMHPIPLVHGMTVGELAQMIVGEGWLETEQPLSLTVIPVANYNREMRYELPVRPSPNLPNYAAVRHYPSLGFFEPTPVSIGRGTDFPFQVIGHDSIYVTGVEPFHFTPRSIPGAATHPKFEGGQVTGLDLRHIEADGLNLAYLIAWHQQFASQQAAFFTSPDFMDKLAGTDKLRKAIEAGKTEREIRQGWQQDLDAFLQRRQPYLLYP
ncbi:exo-beta-N-acetylmuramidase NamZ family protein [Bowmanella dokdonensis]|uniref:DUF1343 domain-containing protein n=1 Tax=Bowmanella dokdonensis TaxID=751969 RepID=A0A939DMF2_9ALTE|nr:DUF1343 domain-containing protein [Bowmanella dokdonensis]MBN7825322.1 DUF1343 domain-containing protein [Bowmanella dokdonensis]